MADDPLREVLHAIDAGAPIDWAELSSKPSDDALRSVLPDLEIVAGIARFHRALHAPVAAAADDGAVPSGMSDTDQPVWGPLQLLERIGSGAFGDVYRAWDRRLDREVALKLLRGGGETTEPDSDVVHEGRQLARVHHPNVVTVFGADVIAGRVGIWMEFIRGRTLEALLGEGTPFPWHDSADVGIAVCQALEAVHAAGLIHQDVNAQNVMRDDSGRIVLMDFGAARHSVDQASGVVGTPLYLAPELLEGKPASRASDVYAVGVLLYRLVSGRYPITGADLDALRETHRVGRRTRLRDERRDLPAAFVSAVDRALDPRPAQRHASAADFAAALHTARSHERAGHRWPSWPRTLGGLLAAAAAVAIVAAVQRREPTTVPPSQSSVPADAANTGATLPVVTRRVPLPDSPYPSRPSLDGRYLPFIADGNVGVLELDSLRTRTLTAKRANLEFAYGPTVVSPDSRWVAYTWAGADRHATLRVVDVAGSGSRDIWVHEGGADLQPVEWSVDGTEILVVGPAPDGVQMALVGLADGRRRVLLETPFRPMGASLSPDGRFVAYDRPSDSQGHTRDIYVIDTTDSRERAVVTDVSNDVFPLWLPDGTALAFASDRAGTFGLWKVRMADGFAVGEPEVVERDMGRMLPMGVTRDGSFYYFLKTELVDVYTAELNPATLTLVGTPRPVAPNRLGSNITSDWSPDGRSLAYVSIRGFVSVDRFSRALTIRDMQTGEERDLWPEMAFFLSPRWSPDGRTMLVSGLDLQRRGGIHQIDLATGRTSPVVVGPGLGEYEWAPDGRSILYRKGADRIVSRNLATGAEASVLDLSAFGAGRLVATPGPPPPLMLRTFQPSPDGQRLALTRWSGTPPEMQASLAVHSPGTAPLAIHTTRRLGLSGWSPDGRAIFFQMPTDQQTPSNQTPSAIGPTPAAPPSRPSSSLWWIPATGGDPHPVGLERPGLSTVRVSPDARRVTFTAGFDGGEMRVAERLLSR